MAVFTTLGKVVIVSHNWTTWLIIVTGLVAAGSMAGPKYGSAVIKVCARLLL